MRRRPLKGRGAPVFLVLNQDLEVVFLLRIGEGRTAASAPDPVTASVCCTSAADRGHGLRMP